MKTTLTVLLAAFALPFALSADEKPSVEKTPDSLLVYGKSFLFSVKEPPGWVSDTENAAKYGANIIFYPAAQKGKTGKIIIRVLITAKDGKEPEEEIYKRPER